MPHFGLMDASKMNDADAALLRARLHLRGGRRRIRQGNNAAALAALYDALIHAIRWYLLVPSHQKHFGIQSIDQVRDERAAFLLLSRAHILDDITEFDRLTALVEKTIDDPAFKFDAAAELANIESMLMRLGVLPFDEKNLPPEDPSTL